MTPRTLCRIVIHPACALRAANDTASPPPSAQARAEELIFRIHAHAARLGRTGPAPLICPGART